MCVCAKSLSHIQLFAAPWIVAHLAPLSMGILQARILKRVATPSSRGSSQPRDGTQGSNPGLLHCRQILYHLEPPGKPDACACAYVFISFKRLLPLFKHRNNLSFVLGKIVYTWYSWRDSIREVKLLKYNSKEGIDSTLPSHPSSLTIPGNLS